MGLDRSIRFPGGDPPAWEAVGDRLAHLGEAAPVRMIDGLPAFPDEVPDPGWDELRVGFPAGMVTLRRTPAGYSCVVWGNADPALRACWDKLCWAVAAAGNGVVDTPAGPQSAADFARAAGITPSDPPSSPA
jgi:hypothetical protein